MNLKEETIWRAESRGMNGIEEAANYEIREVLRKHNFMCVTIFTDVQKELWYGKIDGRMVVVHVMGGGVDYFTEHHGILGTGRLQNQIAAVEL